MKKTLQLVFAVMLCCAVPAAASAEPIMITSGSFSLGPGTFVGGNMTLRGTDGVRPFSFDGRINGGDAAVDLFACSPCIPSRTDLSVGIEGAGSAISGNVTYGGDTYHVGLGSFLDSDGSIFLHIAGSGVQPPPPSAVGVTTTFMVPFTASGFLIPPADLVLGVRYPFLGSGTATVTLFGDPGSGTPVWAFRSADYSFSDQVPVPEPTSVLLLTTGLAGVILRRRGRSTFAPPDK